MAVPLSSPPDRVLSVPLLWKKEKRAHAVVIPISTEPQPATDESLMTLLPTQPKEALAELFRRHSRLVFSIGFRVLRDAGEAEEIVQEVFLYLHQKSSQFDETRGTAKAWIVQIAHHRALDRRSFLHRRHFYAGTDLTVLTDTLAGTIDLERELVSKLNRTRLQQAFEDLSEKQRLTLELYFFEGLELKEVAERINESHENVRHFYYRKQSLSIGYVASLGRKLSTIKEYTVSMLNPQFSSFYLYENGPGSNYNSLQVKYQRQMAHGLQALASYTWSHAIDWASADNAPSAVFPLQRGNADFDVRNNFTGALVYSLPTQYQNKFEKAILGYWNANAYVVARSAFPYEPVGPAVIDPVTGYQIAGELNYNGAQPYVYKAGIPGGRQINPAIFSVTTNPLGVGNAPRNFLRGFGEAQANLAIQRTFPLYERSQLLFRAEAFNIANNPTFGVVNTTCGVTTPGATCTNVLMGQATNTLSTALGGTAALYQQGGPRSLQFMLKFLF